MDVALKTCIRGGVRGGCRIFRLGFRDDAVENRNLAAGAVTCGAVWGAILCFAGANAGEGETIWTTFFPAAASTSVLWLLWFILATASGVADAITIDRDTASGLRLAGLLIACGLNLGRAGAGGWHGTDECLSDMVRIGWPAGALALVALIAQWLLRPTPRTPRPAVLKSGIAPAAAFVGFASGYVLWLGLA